MDTTTINQLIESVGIVIVALISVYAYLTVLKWRKTINREGDLLKDIIFLRTIEQKYLALKNDNDGKNGFIKMRLSV